MKNSKEKLVLAFGLMSLGIALSQSSAAQDGFDPQEMVRKFDGLCTMENVKGEQGIYARFLPNVMDYYTKMQPSAPITKGEHARTQLIIPAEEVYGFIDMATQSGIQDVALTLQIQEMEKARASFEALDEDAPKTALPSCNEPFPAP